QVVVHARLAPLHVPTQLVHSPPEKPPRHRAVHDPLAFELHTPEQRPRQFPLLLSGGSEVPASLPASAFASEPASVGPASLGPRSEASGIPLSVIPLSLASDPESPPPSVGAPPSTLIGIPLHWPVHVPPHLPRKLLSQPLSQRPIQLAALQLPMHSAAVHREPPSPGTLA